MYIIPIIYPGNRIVVDYGEKRGLVFLAAIDNATGKDVPVSLPIETARRHDGIRDYQAIKSIQQDNAEGFVLLWENGFRLKVKFDEYVRLHRIITNTSARTIWEYIAINDVRRYATTGKLLGLRLKMDPNYAASFLTIEGDLVSSLLQKVPDEFYLWVNDVKTALLSQFTEIEETAKLVFEKEYLATLPRKEAALVISTKYKELAPILFLMLDGQEYSYVIWNMLYPEHALPFKEDQE